MNIKVQRILFISALLVFLSGCAIPIQEPPHRSYLQGGGAGYYKPHYYAPYTFWAPPLYHNGRSYRNDSYRGRSNSYRDNHSYRRNDYYRRDNYYRRDTYRDNRTWHYSR